MASVGPEAQCLITMVGKSWEKLGNKGWSWNDLLPCFKKSEKFTFNVEPHNAQELHTRPQSAAHGYNGSVHVSYPQ
ncbi:hypothetical protein AU210_010386 [Fusarium oxysporum f. sp. radicis-cucumerinum]|uniref:Uncharacterized protein n=1 Tax=Fusarium oxysporum f. sp. radicis-cucumerinum TaxID=327505 RepID=A0A2H3GJ62_FUSOX|nr:hypothetical protein AU210_010386 [Fusarium oxysporum f. sp. radicis-cucumerinum]